MRRVFLLITCLGASALLLHSWGRSQDSREPGGHPPAPLPAPPVRELPRIAGRPYEEVRAIARRHQEELMKVPGVYIVGVGEKGILVGVFVHTTAQGEKPATLPPALQALPATIEGLPVEVRPLYVLPPPPGVIVLKPGGIREQADACPREFQEIFHFGWRFCVDRNAPEPIPTAMTEPPIAGIPYEEALKILERHREELSQLPGVTAVGMGSEGITVETTNPSAVPSAVDGVPVKVRPPRGQAVGTDHTFTAPSPQLHGGVAVSSIPMPTGMLGTLNGIALSEGKPYLILPTHILHQCGSAPPCALASSGQPPLNSCNHTPPQPPSENIQQSPSASPTVVGRTIRWDHLVPITSTSTDVAAAFMDNDSIEGNASLTADRRQEMWTEIMGREFTGIARDPRQNEIVRIVTANLPHVMEAIVTDINQTKWDGVAMFCLGQSGPKVVLTNQMYLRVVSTYIRQGDSGGAILDGAGSIVGMLNWRILEDPRYGGGTMALEIRRRLGFDEWYGTLSVNDNSFGTFRPSQGRWYLDNGDGKPVATDPGEFRITYGTNGDLAVTGVWQAGGERCLGAYRPSQGRFYLDYNCDGVTDAHMTLGTTGDMPVAGDWNNDGVTDLGVWRPSVMTFYLDFNGNRVWGGCNQNGDKCFTYGLSTDKPVAGTWGGSTGSAAKTGVYRPSTGTWYLEKANDGWVTGQEIVVGPFGLSDDKPVIGNWTGVGPTDKIGVFQPSGGGIVVPFTWVLDNGDGAFTSFEREQKLGPFGIADDQPVAWRKTVWKGN